MDDEDFTTSYITNTIPNSPSVHQIPTQAKQNVGIIVINGEYSITYQCELDKLNCHQTPRGKSNIKIGIFIRKRYHRTDIEYICSRFDKVRPVASHLEVLLPKKLPKQKNIGEGLKGIQKKLWKEY